MFYEAQLLLDKQKYLLLSENSAWITYLSIILIVSVILLKD